MLLETSPPAPTSEAPRDEIRVTEEVRSSQDDQRDSWMVNRRVEERPPLWTLLRTRKIALAFALLVGGIILITISSLLYTGHWEDVENRAGPLMALGVLLILPGGYMTRIAYKAWKGERGFSFNLIPEV